MKYNLSGFFNKFKQIHPQFKGIIEDYERQLKEISVKRNISMKRHEEQFYTQNFYLNDDSFYSIIWSVERAKEIAIENYKEGPNMKFFVPTVYHSVRKEDINIPYLDIALDNNEPVIIGYHSAISKPNIIVIDGNHRIVSRAQAGISYVQGYFLTPKMHIECMLTNLDQLLYKIHHNLYKHVMQSQGNPLIEFQYDDGFID